MAQQQGDVDRLLDHHHRGAVVVDLAHLVDQAVDDGGRQAERQLVDAEQLGAGDEGHGQRQLLLLAAREVAGQLVVPLAQDGEHGDGLVDEAAGGVLVVAQHPARQPQVLGHRQRGEHALAARHERQAESGDLLGGQPGDVAPVERDATLAGGQQAGDRLQQGRLAGAVGAEQGEQLVALDVDVDAEQHLQRPVRRLDALAGQQVGAEALAAHAAHHQPGADRVAVGRGEVARLDRLLDGLDLVVLDQAVPAGDHPHEPVAGELERLGEAAGDEQQDGEQADAGQQQLGLAGTSSPATAPARRRPACRRTTTTPPMTAIENTQQARRAG